jgi:hypothetical protein
VRKGRKKCFRNKRTSLTSLTRQVANGFRIGWPLPVWCYISNGHSMRKLHISKRNQLSNILTILRPPSFIQRRTNRDKNSQSFDWSIHSNSGRLRSSEANQPDAGRGSSPATVAGRQLINTEYASQGLITAHF